LIPVQATGFEDLEKRIEEQDKTTEIQQKWLEVGQLELLFLNDA
jgi:hypothetical protein